MSIEIKPAVQEQPAQAEALVCRLPARPLKSGEVCPSCGAGQMDYDGLLNLRCEHCGYTQSGGCFT